MARKRGRPRRAGRLEPGLGMRIRWNGTKVAEASLIPGAPGRYTHVAMPADEKTLAAIGASVTGQSRARLYVALLVPEQGRRGLRLCVRGAPGAVRITGPVTACADFLVRQTQEAMRRVAVQRRRAGDAAQADRLQSMAAALPAAKRAGDKEKRSGSVRAVSGGLPSLGRHT
ncbi:hypothetical protein ACFU9Y_02240 [Streptomyces sp. NPDC057621]|uniref:hypothetical protein n=1 Tax=Streptomyces sp. NPDC057621 TaxID=3346186 RepID=UPI0036CE038A